MGRSSSESGAERRARLVAEANAVRLELDAAGDAGGDASAAAFDALLTIEGEIAALDSAESIGATL